MKFFTKTLLTLFLFSPISGAAIDDSKKNGIDNYEKDKTYEFMGKIVFIKGNFYFLTNDSSEEFALINSYAYFFWNYKLDTPAKFELKMIGRDKDNLPLMEILDILLPAPSKGASSGDTNERTK